MNPVEVFLQTNTDEETYDKVEQTYKDNPTDENKYKAACSLIESGDCNAAVEDGLQYLYQLYDGDYDNVKKLPNLLSKFVYVFIKQEMYERAKQWLDEWLELQPNNQEALLVQQYVEKKMAEIETQDSKTCCVVL